LKNNVLNKYESQMIEYFRLYYEFLRHLQM